MKLAKTVTLFSILFFGLVSVSFAAPWKGDDNTEPGQGPDIVNRTDGPTTVVGKYGDDHNGIDLVMRAGKSGVFHQWFEGNSEEGPNPHGDHSVWRPVDDVSECNEEHGWYPIEDAGGWDGGLDYFEDGQSYCVKTNQYNPAYYNNL